MTAEPSKALAFFRVVGQLKTLKRTGWVNHAIALPESVADHMYRMSMMAFLIEDQEVNKDKLMKIWCEMSYMYMNDLDIVCLAWFMTWRRASSVISLLRIQSPKPRKENWKRYKEYQRQLLLLIPSRMP